MLAFLNKLKWYFKEHKLRYIMIVILLIMTNILEVIPPQLIGRTIDAIDTGMLTFEMMWIIFGIFIGTVAVIYILVTAGATCYMVARIKLRVFYA